MELQKLIHKAGMTNKDFAEKIGCDSPTVSRFTNYKCLPIPKTMKDICKVLDCSVEDVYSREEIYYSTKRTASKKADKYKLTVSLPKEAKEFFKKALKKCGYHDITDWVNKCYVRLQKQYDIIETKEREKALRNSEKPTVK